MVCPAGVVAAVQGVVFGCGDWKSEKPSPLSPLSVEMGVVAPPMLQGSRPVA